MKLWNKILKALGKDDFDEEENLQGEDWDNLEYDRDKVDFRDRKQREHFVDECLEEMRESALSNEHLQDEYRLINLDLKDMEEIDALPPEEREYLHESAQAIQNGLKMQEHSLNNRTGMKETDFNKIDGMADQVEDGIKKLKEAEEYQGKIKSDLRRLEGEKSACKYRMNEASMTLMNLKGITIIVLMAAVFCALVLLILQVMLEMDTQLGYLLMVLFVAVVMTFLFVQYRDTRHEYHVANASYNRVIMLQNKVKIRYVNNTGLLDYLYIKYRVGDAKTLEKLWADYIIEKKERERMEKLEEEMDYYAGALIKQLRNYQIHNPYVWVHRAAAILDPKEMVEIRHTHILQRQSLRKQMEMNDENARIAKEEILQLVKEYPKYAREILERVEDFEKKYML